MSAFEWNADAFIAEQEARAIEKLSAALDTGVEAARAQSHVGKARVVGSRGKAGTQIRFHVPGGYRDGWKKVAPVVQGNIVHGEIINECENDSGEMFARYQSGGWSHYDGDKAHAAGLDAATNALRGAL